MRINSDCKPRDFLGALKSHPIEEISRDSSTSLKRTNSEVINSVQQKRGSHLLKNFKIQFDVSVDSQSALNHYTKAPVPNSDPSHFKGINLFNSTLKLPQQLMKNAFKKK